MFLDFAGFATEVNKRLSWGGWRLQEEANANGLGTRNYTILYNGLNVGKLELQCFDRPYRTADTEISANVEISHARFFSYGTVRSFLETLVWPICADTKVNYRLAKADIANQLAAYFLELLKKPASDYQFTTYIVGRPLLYFNRGEVREESNRFWEQFGQTTKTASSGR